MTSLSLYGGINEIGGNKILVEDKGMRIFLDFGISFKITSIYYSEFLQPKKCNGIRDFIEFGLLPKMEGIYRNDFLKRCPCGLPITNKPAIDGVFLSHAHLDHSAYITHLHPDIPVYCGKLTMLILKSVQETGSGSFKDYVVYAENFITRNNRAIPKRNRNILPFGMGDIIEVGNLSVYPIQVDHSLPGTYGFIVETSGGNVVYTGDLRFHGYKEEMTRDFIEKAKGAEPIALICEGTNLWAENEKKEKQKEKKSEQQSKEEICEIVSNTGSMVMANFPPRDIDRFITFHEAAKENGRKLVINFKQAYLLKLLIEDRDRYIPTIEDKDILIYAKRANWGTVTNPSMPLDEKKKDYYVWERDFLEHPHCVTCEDIKEMQEEVIFYCDFFSLKELIDVRPKEGSRYVWSRM